MHDELKQNLKKDISFNLFSESEFKDLIRLRWLVILVISLLVCLNNISLLYQVKVFLLISLFFISNFIFQISPKKVFQIPFLIDAIFIVDTLFVTLILYFVGKADSDFYLIFYFLVILLVSLNQDVRSIIVMGAIVSLIYGWLLFSLGILSTKSSYHLLLRVPMIFLVTLFYSYIISRTNTIRQEVQKYRQMAMHDELTHLPNRRYLNEYLEWEVKRALRYKRPISFVMIDIDNFKNINDKYGHDAGDIILEGIASILEKNKREHDLVARYGGEEFIWIAPEADKNDIYSITNRLLKKIRNNIFKINENYLKVTVSIGASTFLPKKHNFNAFLDVVNKADEALYQAKYDGKDKYIHLEYA